MLSYYYLILVHAPNHIWLMQKEKLKKKKKRKSKRKKEAERSPFVTLVVH